MAEMKFEEALKKLEKIVGDLENGNLSLDDALDKYEEGIKLSKLCSKKLEIAKKKVEILLKSEDGSFELKDFDENIAGEKAQGTAGKSATATSSSRPGIQETKKKKNKDEGLF